MRLVVFPLGWLTTWKHVFRLKIQIAVTLQTNASGAERICQCERFKRTVLIRHTRRRSVTRIRGFKL
jgi:hypothetical protein